MDSCCYPKEIPCQKTNWIVSCVTLQFTESQEIWDGLTERPSDLPIIIFHLYTSRNSRSIIILIAIIKIIIIIKNFCVVDEPE